MPDITEADLTRARKAMSEWYTRGKPENTQRIRFLLARGEAIPESLLNTSRVRPQANADDPAAYQAPPRSGKGSGVDNWRTFAATATDVDEDVLAGMDRDDIIELLQTRGVIPNDSEG